MASALIHMDRSAQEAGLLQANLEVLGSIPEAAAARLVDSPPVDDSGRWDFGGGRRRALHSRHRPVEDAERLLAGVVADGYPSHLVLIGLGLGHALDAIERWPIETRVLALEPEPGHLAAMLRRRDWRQWFESGRLRVVVGPDYADALEAWTMFGATELPPVVAHPVVAREMGTEVLQARFRFEQVRFATALDPRVPSNSQSMLHYSVLAMQEHFAAVTPAAILEVGSYVGGGTITVCRGIRASGRHVPFWSIEKGGSHPTHPHLPSDDIFGDLQRNLGARGLDRYVTLIQAAADDASMVAWLQGQIAPSGLSLLIIDADGQVQRDFDHYLHLCRPGCVVIVDDYSSPYVPDKVTPTRDAIDRMVSSGILRSDGVHGWGTWIGRVIQPPRQ
jgi:predicted O-methyltransferase YrrM